MATKRDQHRLNRMGATTQDNDLATLSNDALSELYSGLLDGMAAGQSLDDLGSAGANKAAWAGVNRLEKRLGQVKREQRRREVEAWRPSH